ncbi:MAG TPA: energy transducer TonB [Gammaproteobacteria bacterium]|nr:energy transducer TonB [Gammaproteobacteria bacterium]
MNAATLSSATLLLALVSIGSLEAQPLRCDCTSIVDTCTANVEAHGSYLDIKTSAKQCARVDYFVDGQPLVSVAMDGEDRRDWPARTASPKIIVQSCQVCRDNGAAAVPTLRSSAARASTSGAQPANQSGAQSEKAGLEPLIASVPVYPADARRRHVEGYVDVEFTVNALGNVEGAHVTASQPKGTFDSAAVAAVSRWRFAPDEARAPQTLTKRVDFKLDTRNAAEAATGTAAGPRNECVREDAVYNYGDTVDVGLINACSVPLLVFGCAPGTGRYEGRWLCTDSEQAGNVLVPQNDRRLGTRFASGVRSFTYTDGFSVIRAPNSQYWWIACTQHDSTCLSDARDWVRSVGGQPATIDPRDRSRAEVARSN